MKTQKTIRYTHPKSAMEVLHKITPEIAINGFNRTRISVFEELCSAQLFFQQSPQKPKFYQKFLPAKPPVKFMLDVKINPQEGQHTVFEIETNLTRLKNKAPTNNRG